MTNIIGLTGGNDASYFAILAEDGRGETTYYPAVIDGNIVPYSSFACIDDYLAAKVEMRRQTVSYVVSGCAVSAESAVKKLGMSCLAVGPTTLHVYDEAAK